MDATIYNISGKKAGTITLPENIFGVAWNDSLMHQVVTSMQDNARTNVAHTKTRGEVRGGGKKPWKQKGTGRARVGSTRSPIWRHGGITFGPRANQNWELKINKKAKTAALFMSLSDKAEGKQFIIIDQIILEQPKTKDFAKLMKNFKGLGKNQMFLLPRKDDKLFRASRNIPGITPTLANSLNVVDVMKADTIVA